MAKKAKTKTKAKTTIRKKTVVKGKRKSGLSQLTYSVSSELEEIIGAGKVTRPQIVKKIWAYIKAKKCQDLTNRRLIVPDAKLAKVLGNKPIDMLKMAGALNKHIKK